MSDNPLARIAALQSVSGPAPYRPGMDRKTDPLAIGEPGQNQIVLELPVPSLPTWSVKNVAGALVTHENGIFSRSALLADQLTRNPRIAAALNTRTQAVTGLQRQFIPANSTRLARKIAEIANEQWDEWVPPSESEALHQWEVLMGCGLAQILWDETEFPYRPQLNIWHPANLWWFWDFEHLFGRWQLVTGDQGTIEPIPGVEGGCQWLFPQATKKNCQYRGLVRALALSFVAWNQEFRTWARQCEKEGIAALIATVPASADPRLVKALEAQIRNLGSEPQATLRDGGEGNRWKLDMLQPHSTTGYLTFKDFLERNDADIAIAINGQNLTQEVRGLGARAASMTHKEVKWEYTVADATRKQGFWNQQLLRPWAYVNWGDASLAPRYKYVTGLPDDLKERAVTVLQYSQAAVNFAQAGMKVDIDGELEKMGIGVDKAAAPVQNVAPGKTMPVNEGAEEDDSADANVLRNPWPNGYVPPRLRLVSN